MNSMGENMKNRLTCLALGIALFASLLFASAVPTEAAVARMNGEGIAIEAEDMVRSVNSEIRDVNTASGQKVLFVSGNGAASDEMNANPSCMSSFYVNKSSMYSVWIRIKTGADGTTLVYDLDGSGTLSRKSVKGTSYFWQKLENKMYSAGYKEIRITPSDDTYIDKILITSDISYNPGSSALAGLNYTYTSDYFPIDSVKVFPQNGEHPRLFITEESISEIKEKLKGDFFKKDWQNILSTANTDISCALPSDSNSYTAYSSYVEILTNRAFMYVLGEVDSAHVDKTVAEMKNFISTVSFDGYDSTYASRYMGETMVMAACVYDWCYDRFTEADKRFTIRELKRIASLTEVGYPATRRSYVISHAIEDLIYKDQLAVGIAVYDEEPDWYNTVAAIIFDKMLPVKNFLNSSGNDSSGSAYGDARNGGASYAGFMFNTLGLEENIFSDNYNRVFHTWLYNRLPNGMWFKDGDDYSWYNNKANDTRSTLFSWIFNWVGNRYSDPYLCRQAILNYAWTGLPHTVAEIISLDTESDARDVTDLPLTHFTTYPISSMTARTSWQNGLNAPTAMAYVNMREVAVGDHQHMDVGGFQLYYKGMLALDSGLYEWSSHYYDYERRSIAHNVVLVYDPDEVFNDSSVNDGGQKVPKSFGFGGAGNTLANVESSIADGSCVTAKDTVYFSGPDTYKPEFSYISSNIASAYSSKVSEYKRSAVFVNTGDEAYPALFVVYDNLKSSNPDFKKTWLLHSEEEPVTNTANNTVTLTRTADGYNGKLVNTVLVPSSDNAELTVVGGEGKEFWAGGANHPAQTYIEGNHSDMGNYRMELSPANPSEDDVFLNAMAVADADTAVPMPSIYKEENDFLYGVTFLDKAVYFAKSRSGISESFSFDVRSNGFSSVDCLVAGCASGKWRIDGNGADIVVEIKSDGDCFAAELSPGSYTVTPVSADVAVTAAAPKTSEAESFGDFLIRKNDNLMYLPKPTRLVDGVPYVALDGFLTQLGAKIVSSSSVTVGENTLTLTPDSNVYAINGVPTVAEHSVLSINGELYCAVEDFASLFGLTDLEYNPTARLLSFKREGNE